MEARSSKPSQKRRAVLKGSLAAPVVLTVSSASATTMTTLGRCLANLDNAPEPTYLVDSITSTDTWLRIKVPVYRLAQPNNDVIAEYAFFDNALNAYRKVPYPHEQVVFPNGVNASNLRKTDVGYRWGLQWVDEVSKTASSSIQIEPPSGYRAVTGTCWTSFTAKKI